MPTSIYILLVLLALIVLSLSILISRPIARRRRIKNARKALLRVAPTSTDVSEVFASSGHAVAIDTSSQTIYLYDGAGAGVVPFSELLDAQVRANGNAITDTTTDRGSQVAGAAVGGLLLGPVGLLLGGLSGKKTSRQKQLISEIALQIFTSQIKDPVRTVIMHRGAALSPTDRVLRKRAESADAWYARVIAAIKSCQSAPTRAPQATIER